MRSPLQGRRRRRPRSVPLISPSSVAGPVAQTRDFAVPLTTELPMKAALSALLISDFFDALGDGMLFSRKGLRRSGGLR